MGKEKRKSLNFTFEGNKEASLKIAIKKGMAD